MAGASVTSGVDHGTQAGIEARIPTRTDHRHQATHIRPEHRRIQVTAMPTSPLSLCVVTGCPNLVASGRCEDHRLELARESDRRRPNGTQRGWSAKWAAFSKQYLQDHPLCESNECRALPAWVRPASTDVDHIDGTGRNGPRAYDHSNLAALCHSCHSRKTARMDGGFGR